MDSWDYEECLDMLDYMPRSNNFLDVWQIEGSAEPIIHEGILDGEILDGYLLGGLNKASDRPVTGGLRLIFTQMLAKCHCFFAETPTDGKDVEIDHFSYIFSTMFHHYPFWALAAAWNPEKNITCAFLHCTSDSHQESIPRLKRFLIKMTKQYMHPILLPVIIMDLETALTLNDDEAWTSEINDIEDETRQRPNIVAKPLNLHELDLYSIIQRLNGCSVFLSLIERESEAVLLHLVQARIMILELQSISPKLRQSSMGLIKSLEFLVNSRKNLFIRLQNLQRRSQTQLNFAYSFLALRDKTLNVETKEQDD